MNAQLPPSLDDARDLAKRLASLVREERSTLVEFLKELGRFDAEQLYLGLGYGSLFAYCVGSLRLAKSSAFRRITTARLMRRFPVITDFLSDGRLNLTRVCFLKDGLTLDNHLDVLTRASQCSEDDVRSLAASLNPKPNVPDSIRKLPERAPQGSSVTAIDPTLRRSATELAARSVELGVGSATDVAARTPELGRGSAADVAVRTAELGLGSAVDVAARTPELGRGSAVEPIARTPELGRGSAVDLTARVPDLGCGSATEPTGDRGPGALSGRARRSEMSIEPLSGATHLVKMTVGREFIQEFEEVCAALSHKIPTGDFEEVLRECFRVTLAATERRRCGRPARASTDRNQPAGASTEAAPNNTPPATAAAPEERAETPPAMQRSRHIPAAVRRKVWTRDGGRCAFVGPDGTRCNSTWQVDFNHQAPFATGGPPTVENLNLCCRVHNHYEARLAFGAEFMAAKIADARAGRASAVPARNRSQKHPVPETGSLL